MDALFSRSGSSTGLGKCTDEVKALVPEEIKSELSGLAAIYGVSLSEYVRDVLTIHTKGAVHVLRLRARIGNGTEGNGKE